MNDYKSLLAKMLNAVSKCMSISEKIKSVEDIENTMIYDVLLSNLILIRDIEKKLPETVKQKYPQINWEIFDYYDNEITDKYELKDKEVIFKILQDLPELFVNLEKIFDTNFE